MVKRVLTVVLTLIVAMCFVSTNAASRSPAKSAEKSIKSYAEMFAFGKVKTSATGLTKDQSKLFADDLMTAFRGYSLNDENFAMIQKKYLGKLKKITKIETVLRQDDPERPVVTVIATMIDQSAAEDWAIHNQDRVLTRAVINRLCGLGNDEDSLKQDRMFQNFALRSINKFTDEMPIVEQRTIDVTCKLYESENGKLYWVPEDTDSLNEFLNPGFMVDNPKESDIANFISALYGDRSAVYTPFEPVVKPQPTTPEPPVVPEISEPVVTPQPTTPTTTTPVTYNANDKWLIYWYVCGTDIESTRDPGDVTRCIEEVEKANLSSNVKILMQAGGTNVWKHPKFAANNGKVGRYVYSANDRSWTPRQMFAINDPNHNAHMGSYEGLREFLEYGKQYEKENGIPDHRLFIFVDHGGGSLVGVCNDELFGRKPIGLADIRKAFTDVWRDEINSNNLPFEVVAFDTCVMSTYETAVSLEGIARYMVASQESIWGNVMFEYTGLLNGLSANPAMNGSQLGKLICDTYRKDADAHAYNKDVLTMSVIDIGKMPNLKSAYEEFGSTALRHSNNYSFTSFLKNAADNSERYPCDFLLQLSGSDESQCAVDLRNFAENVITAKGGSAPEDLKQASRKLINAIDNAVVYNEIRGSALRRGGGLSTPYPYVMYRSFFDGFENLANSGLAPKSQSALYKQLYETVKTPGPGVNISSGINAQSGVVNIAPGSVFDLSDLNGSVVNIDKDDKKVYIHFTKEEIARIAGVRGQIAHFKIEDDVMRVIYLGTDTRVTADWELRDFTGEFDGRWIMINEQPIFVQVYSEAPMVDGKKTGTELYISPIVLNDKICNLMIACDYPSETFRIVGARPEVNSSTPTGEVYGVEPGDVVKPVYLEISIPKKLMKDDEKLEKQTNELHKLAEEFKALNEKAARGEEVDEKRVLEIAKKLSKLGIQFVADESATFTIGDSVEIKRDRLPDAHYLYFFELINPVGGANVFSDMEAVFTLENGKLILRSDEDVPELKDFNGYEDED